MSLFYKTWMVIGRLCFTVFGRWEVEGRENVPPGGPLLVVSNHVSNADPPVLLVSFNRPLHGLAKEGLFKNPIGRWFFRNMGAHPVRRGNIDTGALRWVLEMLRRDKAVLVFPEGRRSVKPGMQQGKTGAAYIALRSQALILPVGITGTEKLDKVWRLPMPLCRFKVKIGRPFTLPSIEGKLTDPVLQQMTDIIMGRIAEMLPPEYRGAYEFKRATTASENRRAES